jgi:hypothetical protein
MRAIAKLGELLGMLLLGILFFGMMVQLTLYNLAFAYVGWRMIAALFSWLLRLIS